MAPGYCPFGAVIGRTGIWPQSLTMDEPNGELQASGRRSCRRTAGEATTPASISRDASIRPGPGHGQCTRYGARLSLRHAVRQRCALSGNEIARGYFDMLAEADIGRPRGEDRLSFDAKSAQRVARSDDGRDGLTTIERPRRQVPAQRVVVSFIPECCKACLRTELWFRSQRPRPAKPFAQLANLPSLLEL